MTTRAGRTIGEICERTPFLIFLGGNAKHNKTWRYLNLEAARFRRKVSLLTHTTPHHTRVHRQTYLPVSVLLGSCQRQQQPTFDRPVKSRSAAEDYDVRNDDCVRTYAGH